MDDQPLSESSELTLETWKDQGRALAKTGSDYQFEVAKWILTGDTRWGGSAYDEAEKVTGYARKTLIEWAYVARNVSIRMDGLKFGHHQLVASMEPVEQERWLRMAADGKFPVASLRKQIAEERKRTAMPFSVPLTKEVYEKLQVLARASGISEQALALRAVTDLLALSAEKVRAQADAELAEYRAKQHAEHERAQLSHHMARARSEGMKEWGKQRKEARDKYVDEKVSEQLGEVEAARVLVNEAEQSLASLEQRWATRSQAPQSEENEISVAVAQAEYDEAKTQAQANLDRTKDAFVMAHQTLNDERVKAQAEAREKYPDPTQLSERIFTLKEKAGNAREAARSASNYAANAAQHAADKARAAEELRLEAEQADKAVTEAEANLETQAVAAGAAATQ
jgi:hypothetical protein